MPWTLARVKLRMGGGGWCRDGSAKKKRVLIYDDSKPQCGPSVLTSDSAGKATTLERNWG
jgi:hypothetical protein